MRCLYIDCSMGAAGDMLMGALLELHPQPSEFLERLNGVLGQRVHVSVSPDKKCGISGSHVQVLVDGQEEGHKHHEHEHDHHHEHVNLDGIYRQINQMDLPDKVREDARQVYGLVAAAESAVHGQTMENIHFHELGSLDALADIVGVCMLMQELEPEQIMASPIHVGSGMVKCAHGILPVPAPATERILRGLPIYSTQVRGELCTPTGAALLRHFVGRFGGMPVMCVEKSGYGTGTKDFETANVLRVMLGQTQESAQQILELHCNLDDMSPEAIAFATEQLFAKGALDVYTTAIGMKKNRPGLMLSCMCPMELREDMLRCIFKHTSTLGVREYSCQRETLKRQIRTVDTACGPVRIKTVQGWGVEREKPEYEDLAAIARAQEMSLREVEKLL